jgi:hypothetical protein
MEVFFLHSRNGEKTMSDIFRVVCIADDRPTMKPLSSFGHFPARRNSLLDTSLRGTNHGLLTDSWASEPSPHVTADEFEEYEPDQEFAMSPCGQNHNLSRKPHRGSVAHVVTEGAEHRVNIDS